MLKIMLIMLNYANYAKIMLIFYKAVRILNKICCHNTQERLLPASVTDEYFNALQAITRDQLVSPNCLYSYNYGYII